jgi:hypothetical protein
LDAVKKRTLWLMLALLAIVGVIGWTQFATHDTPAGQPPLAYLDSASLATLKAEFNQAASETRLIVLLSPT